MPAQEVERLGPGILGRRLPVFLTVAAHEGVSGAVIAVELVRLAERRQHGVEPVDVVRRRVRVVVAEEAGDGADDIAETVRRGGHLAHLPESVAAIPDAAAPPAAGIGCQPDPGRAPAHTVTDKGEAIGVDVVFGDEPVGRGLEIEGHLLIGEIVPARIHVDAFRQGVVVIGRDRSVTVRRKLIDEPPGEAVEPAPVKGGDHAWEWTGACQHPDQCRRCHFANRQIYPVGHFLS